MWKTPKRSRFILHQFSSPRPLFKIIFWCIHPTQWHLFCIFLLLPLAPGRNCPETCKCLKKITCGQMTLFKAFSFHFGYFSDHFWIILDPKPQSWSLDQTRPDQGGTLGPKTFTSHVTRVQKNGPKMDSNSAGTLQFFLLCQIHSFLVFLDLSNDTQIGGRMIANFIFWGRVWICGPSES